MTSEDRALYEYRGNRPDPVLEARRHEPPAASWVPDANDSVVCASCNEPAQKLGDGWWCDSCGSAAR